MGSRTRWILAVVVLLVISGSAFVGGVASERSALIPGSVRYGPADQAQQFGIFWEAWDLVRQHFVDRSAVIPLSMTYGAIQGMVDSLGDAGHSRFLTPDEAAFEASDIAGQFQGIGAELGQRDGNPVIIAPLDDSPAQKAGILAGDVIVEVDGQPVAGLPLGRVVQMIRGPEGTAVTLSVIHPGETAVSTIKIVRVKIQVRPVSWTMSPGTTVAHLRISQFTANSNADLLAALKEIRSSNARAMVVDVRSNVGGLLDQAISVSSQFLSSGNVLLEQDAQGNRKPDPVEPGGQATEIPIVVLIDRGTASGAEIFAGAIQDGNRGKLIGVTTFGTGTVLSTFRLSDGSELLLGTSEWLTPAGRQIWKHGIEPDEKVELPSGVQPLTPQRESGMTPDQLRSSGDAQLLRGLELLGAG